MSSFSHELEEKAKLLSSYFGAKRIRGKRGRGAAGKIPVLCKCGQIASQCADYKKRW
jgi:hypothetical protein